MPDGCDYLLDSFAFIIFKRMYLVRNKQAILNLSTFVLGTCEVNFLHYFLTTYGAMINNIYLPHVGLCSVCSYQTYTIVLCHNRIFSSPSSTLNGSCTDKQFCTASSSFWRNLKFSPSCLTAVRSTGLRGNGAFELCCSLKLWITLRLTGLRLSFCWMTTSIIQTCDMTCTNLQDSVSNALFIVHKEVSINV